jgi:Porin subfamily
MNRLGIGMIYALSVCSLASADDVLPIGRVVKSPANARCRALGQGFFPVAGSDACVKISGHVSAGVGFGSGAGSRGAPSLNFAGSQANGFDSQIGGAADLRFQTPAGPGRVYVDVRKDTNPRWAIESQ